MLSALSTSISNIVSLFLQTLRFSALLPALFFVAFNQFILPEVLGLDPQSDNTLEFFQQPAWTILLTVIIAYTLSTLNIPIIRLFEGYGYRHSLLGAWSRQKQIEKMQREEKYLRLCSQFYTKSKSMLESEYTEDEISKTRLYSIIQAEVSSVRQKRNRQFPSKEAFVLPTALGNSIAAFEEYPDRHYGIDAINLWSRLLPILSEKQYAGFVQREKAALDFMLHSSVLMGCLGFEGVFFELLDLRWGIELFFIFLPIAYCFYRGSIAAASNWGESVKVAFDLYRYELAKRLSLRPVWSMSEEKVQWKQLSDFIRYPNREFVDYGYPLPRETKKEG
jgi:ABC-type multidrug transport system fused ATPase/permease subunit